MSDTVQNVRIRFTSDTTGLNNASKELSNLSKAEAEAVKGFRALNDAGVAANKNIQAEEKKTVASTKEVEKSAGNASKSFNAVGASIVAAFSVASITAFVGKVVSVTSEFQKLEAVLTNTLGSKGLAKSALQDIQTFAAKTNFSVLELTNGFVKLANSGFVPTERELTQLADVANSTGKSFDQLVEAILDANTFQFERLKEFGIKANQEGDKIKFTFKGVTTEVDKSSAAVQAYILSLGDLEGVTGSTAAISETLGGQVSNLGDSLDRLFLSIGTANDGVLKGFVSSLNNILNTFSDIISFNSEIDSILLSQGLDAELTRLKAGSDFAIGYLEAVKKITKESKSFEQTFAFLNREFERNEQLLKDGKINQDQYNASVAILRDTYSKAVENQAAQAEKQKKLSEQAASDAQRLAIEQEKRNKKAADDARKKFEQDFRNAAELINSQEKREIAKAKLADKSQADILRIEDKYNDKRIDLFGKYGKTRTEDYKFLVLKTEELEKELTQFYTQEEESRRKARLELRDKQLSDIEQSGKAQISAQQTVGNSLIEEQRNLYATGKINKEQFDLAIEDIDYKSKRRQIEIAIQADQDKLSVTKLSAEQIATIEKDLNDKKKELNDLDFENFQSNEEKKVKAAKTRAETIKQIEQAAFEASTSIIGSLFQIGQNNRDAEYQDLEAQKKNELSLAGDNKQKQAEINARFAKKELELKRKSAQADKDQASFDAIINAAVAVTKAFAQGGVAGFVTGALVAAATGLQVAAIQSRPLPRFFEGSEFVELNGNKPGRDTIPAMINYGERIVPTDINKSLAGIPNSELPKMAEMWRKRLDYEGIQREIISGRSGGSQDGVIQELKNVSKKLDRIKTAEINIDKNGIKTLIKTSNSEVEMLNNYFRM